MAVGKFQMALSLGHRLLLSTHPQTSCQFTAARFISHKSLKKQRQLRREAKDMSWTEPLQEFNKERELSKEKEPHKLHVVWRVRPITGRPWWEKHVMKRLGLDGEMNQPAVHKNIPSINEMLMGVKHLVTVKPLTFPHGLPEHESDFDHMYIKPTGEAFVKKRLTEHEPVESTGPDESEDKWKMSLCTVRKDCDRIRLNYKIHTEYHKTCYEYKKNQDGKEYRYKFNKNIRPYSY